MVACNACGKPKPDDRYRACGACREGWRKDKGRKTVPVEEYRQAAAKAAMADELWFKCQGHPEDAVAALKRFSVAYGQTFNLKRGG